MRFCFTHSSATARLSLGSTVGPEEPPHPASRQRGRSRAARRIDGRVEGTRNSTANKVFNSAMKRALAILPVLFGLALAPAASARVVELGDGATPTGKPSCPASGANECQAVGRVTGYMGRSGDKTNPFIIPRAGKLIAFTIALGSPTSKE